MIKSFSGQVVFCFAILEPNLLTFTETSQTFGISLEASLFGTSKMHLNPPVA